MTISIVHRARRTRSAILLILVLLVGAAVGALHAEDEARAAAEPAAWLAESSSSEQDAHHVCAFCSIGPLLFLRVPAATPLPLVSSTGDRSTASDVAIPALAIASLRARAPPHRRTA